MLKFRMTEWKLWRTEPASLGRRKGQVQEGEITKIRKTGENEEESMRIYRQ